MQNDEDYSDYLKPVFINTKLSYSSVFHVAADRGEPSAFILAHCKHDCYNFIEDDVLYWWLRWFSLDWYLLINLLTMHLSELWPTHCLYSCLCAWGGVHYQWALLFSMYYFIQAAFAFGWTFVHYKWLIFIECHVTKPQNSLPCLFIL